MTSYRTRVAGTGSYLPKRILSNFDLEKMVETSDQWIRERTGIERRHIAADDEFTTDLAYHATLKALEAAGKTAQEIEMIVFATVTGDQTMPSSSCVLQEKLGVRGIPCFDLSAACSGFVYGLSVADQFIRTGMYKTVLVIGAEVLHPFVDYKDRETCILFGDGGGAFVLERAAADSEDVVLSTHLHAEGSLSPLLTLATGGSKVPLSQAALDSGAGYVRMKGREIFKHAVKAMSASCEEALKANHVHMDDVAWLVPHQANSRILEAVASYFGFPAERVVSVVHEIANSSAATVPIAFDMAVRDGRIKRGQLILLTAFGAGLTSGSCLLRF